MSSPLKTLAKRWKVVAFGGLVLGLLALGLSLFLPLEYRADTQLLIIARQQYGVDPFTVSKSAERVADTLSNTIETDAFFNQVLENSAIGNLREEYDQMDARERREAWNKAIDGNSVFGTNLMNISAFDTDPERAQMLAAAVADTVVKNGSNFVGTLVEVRIVNQPIATKFPVRPNLPLNFLLGFVIGAFAMGWTTVRKHGHHIL